MPSAGPLLIAIIIILDLGMFACLKESVLAGVFCLAIVKPLEPIGT